jgi:hypothetical protein
VKKKIVVRDESSASNADVPVIPSQLKVTHQILSHWEPFRDLKARFADSRRAEQLSLRSQQRIVATVEDSVLRTEMAGLESLEEDAPKRILFYTPMGWLDRSGLTVEMRPGLLASGRRFSQLPWGLRSQLFQKSH